MPPVVIISGLGLALVHLAGDCQHGVRVDPGDVPQHAARLLGRGELRGDAGVRICRVRAGAPGLVAGLAAADQNTRGQDERAAEHDFGNSR